MKYNPMPEPDQEFNHESISNDEIAIVNDYPKRLKNWQIAYAVAISFATIAFLTIVNLIIDNQPSTALAIIFAFGSGMLLTLKRPTFE